MEQLKWLLNDHYIFRWKRKTQRIGIWNQRCRIHMLCLCWVAALNSSQVAALGWAWRSHHSKTDPLLILWWSVFNVRFFFPRVWSRCPFFKLFKGIDHETCSVYCCFAWTCVRNMKRKISYQTRDKELEWNLHLCCIILLNGFHLRWAGLKHLLIFKHKLSLDYIPLVLVVKVFHLFRLCKNLLGLPLMKPLIT